MNHPLRASYGSASSPCLYEGRTARGEANLWSTSSSSTICFPKDGDPTSFGVLRGRVRLIAILPVYLDKTRRCECCLLAHLRRQRQYNVRIMPILFSKQVRFLPKEGRPSESRHPARGEASRRTRFFQKKFRKPPVVKLLSETSSLPSRQR